MSTIPFSAWLSSVQNQPSLTMIEELAREKELIWCWREIEETLRLYPEYFNLQQEVSPPIQKMRNEIARVIPETKKAFAANRHPTMLAFLSALAKRLGLNEGLFLRLVPATMFHQAKTPEDLRAIVYFYKTEHDQSPHKNAERKRSAERELKRHVDETIASAGLSGEAIFELLRTQHGPERGRIMRAVYQLVRDPDSDVDVDFGIHATDIRTRARKAHDLLRQEDIHI